jgi:hypothetical protein
LICFNEGISLMGLIADSDELDILDSPNVIDLIAFKWDCYGRNHHIFGSIMHCVYLTFFTGYVYFVYLVYDD